jgi:hypothetical protein
VHLRLTSPPVKWSCFYGIDTGRRSELLAANLTVDEIRDYLNVDTLAFITLDRLIASTGTPGRVLRRLLHRRLPGPGPGLAHQGRARGQHRKLRLGAGSPVATRADLRTSDLLPADDARRGA